MNTLKEYGELFSSLNLTELSVTEGDFSITMKKEGVVTQAVNTVPAPAAAPAEAPSEEKKEALPDNIEQVKAPLLGVFGLGDSGIKAGDRVNKGDMLCTIEAMKMFNEVTSPVDGVIREICAKEGELVEYNSVLFLIEK